MYRPVMLMASDYQSTTQDSSRFGSEESKKPETTTKTSTSSKGKSRKSAKPKRPKPQRGVGVAQLERLRLQQRGVGVTKLTQMPLPHILPQPQPQTQVIQNVGFPDHQQRQFQYYPNPETRADPLLSIPVLYGASNYDGAMSTGSGLVGLDRTSLFVQTVSGNGGSAGFGYGYNVRLQNDVGGLVMDPNQYGVVGAGAPNRGAVYEISNELSSIPKMKQKPSSSSSSEYCCCCKQKKRFNCGNNMGFGESPAVFPMVNSSDLPGFDQQNIPNVRVAGEIGVGFNAGTYLDRRSSLVDESVEVRAVHRKGRQAGGDIMKEYEFFPDHNNNSSSVVSSGTYPMEHNIVASSTNSSSVGRSSEASDQHLGSAFEGADMMMMMMSSGHSPVDLSLKLSF
ncbi:putative transcription factor NOZZLE family [Rosa chinensis]|uniref:Putative transcription factor NOZZLE family n=1 Tax=Rosa chinensis TaxID=74649 RepID=A0A2P6PLW2_ROSCH|nr:uncharacterized protein LOC121049660 [Rosa chinensis]PRQ22922.1 putative transcription factor NOZZLE family [Rosa chinensis]